VSLLLEALLPAEPTWRRRGGRRATPLQITRRRVREGLFAPPPGGPTRHI